eukprot:GHRQ01002518.1.p1 GENE.GHRQ01002518.1~~GHRQ01002518.1.p1  ORF type:complete len:685 (+),score=199.38 GHRQ01002518.1:243-2297(+)
MIGDGPKAKRLRKAAIIAGGTLLMLALVIIAGFFISKSMRLSLSMRQHATQRSAQLQADGSLDASGAAAVTGVRRGVILDVGASVRQWPELSSREALQLLNDPGADDLMTAMYTWANDTVHITEELTEALLRRLLQQMNEDEPDSGQVMFLPRGTNMTELTGMFVSLARDVLAYLRDSRSIALLRLLRDFARRGAMSMSDVDPDVLQAEVTQLLNVSRLNQWYGSTSKKDTVETQTRPWRTAATAAATQGPPQLLLGGAAAGRRMLSVSQATQLARADTNARHLLATASIPVIRTDQAVKQLAIPTASDLLTLQDMVCAVQSFSPTGLKGMLMPSAAEMTSAGVDDTADAGKAITCRLHPKVGTFHHDGVRFKPVVIPVVFHCQRFMQGDVLQPPIWNPQEAGQNLIDITNKFYEGTGIQFKLQEVRSDVKKHPYLLLSTLDDWQSCTGNPSQETAGFPCLQETAKFPEVAELAEKHVVNVLIGGSQTPMFCNTTASDAVCTTLYYGYTGSIGPWFTQASATWREGLSEENWIVMTWDFFAPEVANSKRFWDGGAVTLAHELGHYLGVMHTHEGAEPCEGEGLDKADAVPDTPVNRQVEQWAAENNLAASLASWCSDFRNGKQPQPKDLLQYNSCKMDGTTDNVFNLMSYLPNACNMMLSPNQVARLQWAVATFRPKMMAAYAV